MKGYDTELASRLLKDYNEKLEECLRVKKICISCSEDVGELFHLELVSKVGEKILICDECYQELSKLEKRNGTWIEFAYVDGVEYYHNTIW